MQMMTKIMRTAAMQAAIMVTEIERAIATKDHTGEDNANTLPRRGEPPLHTNNNDFSSICPPLPNTIQSSGSTMRISSYKLDAGCSMFQSLAILVLRLGASETKVKVHCRQLARKYHPDKNDTAITGLTTSEASTFFQLLNNAHHYLKDCT